MRILIYTSAFLPQIGGAELVVHNLAGGLTENGHRVLVATFQQGAPNPLGMYLLRRLKVLRGAGRLKLTMPLDILQNNLQQALNPEIAAFYGKRQFLTLHSLTRNVMIATTFF